MSMIGKLNFALQEEAEELGFETTQEALDNGYTVHINMDGEPHLQRSRELGPPPNIQKLMDEQEQAHEAWLKDREHILRVIQRLRLDLVHMGEPKKYDYALFEIEAFIRRGEE